MKTEYTKKCSEKFIWKGKRRNQATVAEGQLFKENLGKSIFVLIFHERNLKKQGFVKEPKFRIQDGGEIEDNT
jgi:hypothetical protein